MLAQIEGELNAPDRAVEGLVGEFDDDGSGVGSSSLLPLDDDLTTWKSSQTATRKHCFYCSVFFALGTARLVFHRCIQ
jgi:hypothetical protein